MSKSLSIQNREFFSSLFSTNVTYEYYFTRLMKLVLARFKWNNLPDTCDERYMEEMLCRNGNILFFKDEVLNKFLCLPCTLSGEFDFNMNAKMRQAFAPNGYQYFGDETNSVIIYNNNLKTNSITDIEIYSRDLANLHCTININVHAQKTPILITCNENQKLTMQNLYMKYQGNQPIIFADKNIEMNGIEVIKTDSPYVADNLYELLTQKWNDFLTSIGIDNVATQKKERMNTDEVTRALGAVSVYKDSGLRMRELACEQINKMFGLNISVEFIGNDIYDMQDTQPSKDGESNESVYNRA